MSLIEPGTYEYRTQPFAHQHEVLMATWDKPAFALHWEPGTGKTKAMIDNAAMLWQEGKINGVLVVAPSGIHMNWLTDEIPVHLPASTAKPSLFLCYNVGKSSTQWHQAAVRKIIHHDGLAWLFVSYDAFMTDRGVQGISAFLRNRKCLYILDECSRIKTPKAARTKRVVPSGRLASYRRELDGSPVTQGAFDVYAPMKFLQIDFWKQHALDSFAMFKAYFGRFEKGYNAQQGQEFDKLIGYQRLDDLRKMMAPMVDRRLKSECLDLPPKLYSKRYFNLAPKQRAMYDELREEFRLWLKSGELVTANLAMVRMVRLQQISCGYLPYDEDGEQAIHLIGDNPRLDELMEYVEDVGDAKLIIWAYRHMDIDQIMMALPRGKAVKIDGRDSPEQVLLARDSFQKGDKQYLVANPDKAGEGYTLHAASLACYYTNSYRLRARIQSEDRIHRAGQTAESVLYTDLIANDTHDRGCLENLASKVDIAAIINGDVAPATGDLRSQLLDWLEPK